MDRQEMVDVVKATRKRRKPTSNDDRQVFAEELSGDLERVKAALESMAEMVDELLTAVEEVAEAENMAEMRHNALVDEVREKAQALEDALLYGVDV